MIVYTCNDLNYCVYIHPCLYRNTTTHTHMYTVPIGKNFVDDFHPAK